MPQRVSGPPCGHSNLIRALERFDANGRLCTHQGTTKARGARRAVTRCLCTRSTAMRPANTGEVVPEAARLQLMTQAKGSICHRRSSCRSDAGSNTGVVSLSAV